jgi:hypothetical protein
MGRLGVGPHLLFVAQFPGKELTNRKTGTIFVGVSFKEFWLVTKGRMALKAYAVFFVVPA